MAPRHRKTTPQISPSAFSLDVGALVTQRLIISDQARTPHNEPARPIGRGGTSVVYLADQYVSLRGRIKRAIKFFLPSEKVQRLRAGAGQSYGAGQFLDEINTLAMFSHENLIGIIDAGSFPYAPANTEIPYFVMEYVDRPTLLRVLHPGDGDEDEAKLWQTKATTQPRIVIHILRELCRPLAYLHSRRFFHCDVAPKNIFVGPLSNNPQVILGDVGAGQTVPAFDSLSPGELKTTVHVMGTRDYAPKELYNYMNRRPLPLKRLLQFVPYWDIYAVGRIGMELLHAWHLREHRELRAARVLLEKSMQQNAFSSIADLGLELERLLPEQVITAQVPELSARPPGPINIVVPLGPVHITDRIRRLIDRPSFERLRLVPQLLLVKTVHPGGTHTRFEHAIGAYDLARRYIVRLLDNAFFRVEFRRNALEEALIAALLSNLDGFALDHALFEIMPSLASGKADRERRLANRRELLRVDTSRLRKDALPHRVARCLAHRLRTRVSRRGGNGSRASLAPHALAATPTGQGTPGSGTAPKRLPSSLLSRSEGA